MLTREYVQDGSVNRFTVTKDPEGWEVREERGDVVVKRAHYRDWHRVEIAFRVFELGRDTDALAGHR